ncbi:UNVERIFIED_CONTAM: hypothetical protein K2H54_058570 [Gekko kuhli]
MGNRTTAVLQITKNDDPIYFDDPVIVKVQEGDIANFVVIRNGSDAPAASVMYAAVNRGASAEEEDFIFSEQSGVILFDVGKREQNITLFINDDDVPESDETFYIILFNSTG